MIREGRGEGVGVAANRKVGKSVGNAVAPRVVGEPVIAGPIGRSVSTASVGSIVCCLVGESVP